ncbi:MAG: type IV secretion system protein [Anaeromicrobium sp.]|uniref:type IV secretion system protein n=1 Tax=Anaeromicrobium sp. TaxID=1929132 RepID=UPI0025D03A46|nr:type IV secretion system protein [Anaeromicrobium sp.]MCT4594181.1 type IV secretion system protein [Anaeromicrobium sp.]
MNEFMKRQHLKRIVIIFILLQMMLSPLTVYAHEAVYLQVLIDPNNKKYVSEILTDHPGWSKEGQHIEAKTGNFTDLQNEADKPLKGVVLNSSTLENFKEGEITKLDEKDNRLTENGVDNGLIFTFPAKEEGWFGGKNNASDVDTERAYEIAEKLVASLNGILRTVNDGYKFENDEQLRLTSIYIRPNDSGIALVPAKSGKTYKIVYATEMENTNTKTTNELNEQLKNGGINEGSLFDYFPRSDSNGNLYAYVYEYKDSNTPITQIHDFIYAMPKGYIEVNRKQIIENNYDFINNNQDTAWINIHQLSRQANFNLVNHGFMAGKSGFESAQNWLEKTVYSLISGIFYQLRSLLGLYDTEELVFNEGLRGTKLYNDGMMSQDWWTVVLRYHLIFQAIAWTLIIGAVIKILIQMNFSTINPSMKISIMETLQKLFVVGFLLVTIIPLTQLMASLNNAVVEIFATQVDWSDSARVANHSGMIAGIIIEVVYFFISLYLNFVYLMRSLMIAVLVATGPFFVVTMAFFVKGKGLFDNWSKEMVANIFLQAFHAFAFAFVLNVQGASRGIEEIAVAASLIPLTEFFRTMLFGQVGSFAVRQGKGLAVQSTAVATKGLETFSNSAKNGNRSSSKENNMDKLDNTNNIKDNSLKLKEKSTLSKGAVAGGAVQKTYDAGLATAKIAGGLALENNSLLMDGATDFRNMIEGQKADIKGFFFNMGGDIPEWDKDTGVLLTKETQEKKIPIRPKEYLKDRGLNITPYGARKNGKAKGFTMQISNRSKLQNNDLENIKQFEEKLQDTSINQMQFRKQNGVEDVVFDNAGQIDSISFNKLGMEKMGLEDIKKKDYQFKDTLYKDVLFETRKNNSLDPTYTFSPTYTLPKEKEKDKSEKKAN